MRAFSSISACSIWTMFDRMAIWLGKSQWLHPITRSGAWALLPEEGARSHLSSSQTTKGLMMDMHADFKAKGTRDASVDHLNA